MGFGLYTEALKNSPHSFDVCVEQTNFVIDLLRLFDKTNVFYHF